MCSIFGYVARADARPSLKALGRIVHANIARGPHAFGLAWIDPDGRLHAYKQTGRLTDCLGVIAMARDAVMLVGHLRYATHGDCREQINNHPHPCDGGWLVHNGVVRNHAQLVRDNGLWPVGECDSEVLALLIEHGSGSLAFRAASAVAQAAGPLAMLGLWSRPASLVAVRRGNPLHAASAAEGTYLATLPGGLPGKPRAVPDARLLTITRPGGRTVTTGRDVDWPDDDDAPRASLFDPACYRGG